MNWQINNKWIGGQLLSRYVGMYAIIIPEQNKMWCLDGRHDRRSSLPFQDYSPCIAISWPWLRPLIVWLLTFLLYFVRLIYSPSIDTHTINRTDFTDVWLFLFFSWSTVFLFKFSFLSPHADKHDGDNRLLFLCLFVCVQNFYKGYLR